MPVPHVQAPSFLVSTAAVARWTNLSWENDDLDSLGTQLEFPLSFEAEVDGARDYAAVRLSMELPFEESDAMRPMHLIMHPRDTINVRVQRVQRADPIVRHALWPGVKATSIPDYSVVVISISRKPPALVLGPADGMTPNSDSAELVLNRFKWMAQAEAYKIYVPHDAFTNHQLCTLRHVLLDEAYDLDPKELAKPLYEGYKLIIGWLSKNAMSDKSDPPTSSDESASSHSSPPLSPYRVPNGRRSRAPPVTNKRKRPNVDEGAPSDDINQSIADHLEQLEERLMQRMNAQWEEKVQRVLAESKDAILSEVDTRLNARLAEIRADIANKPYEPREGGVADLDRELELKIEARLPSLREELREMVCDDVKARLISALGHGTSAS
ncbi:hypothetical protein DIS24_g11118 [Lasiodiplodia hormozganensis]|uniref:Uncharacterized protein n=1 Tax=Lasiodiplodia hormozganensis TaxID=869390 RepID=A0AA39X1Q7_9PEZI|nr:hypothetical protein DIS24_g11118 [Lasiodiplodia hormozganensis]